jgi:hypothetical protein
VAAEKKENLVLRARNTVINDLIAAHEGEYHDRMEKACANLGIAYARPLSAEDKARNDIAALLEKYPHLRAEFPAGTFTEDAAPKAFSTV